MNVSYSTSSHPSYAENEKYDLSSQGLSELTDVKIPLVPVLILSNNQITDFSSLPPNDELQVLQADNNKVEVLQPDDFSQCTSLSNLNLSFNLITKMSNIKALQALKSLDLSGNQIKVLENLEGNTGLTNLYLSKNQIHTVFLKSQLPNLLKLDLRRNALEKIPFGEFFPGLTSLHLDHCFLTSFSGLNQMKSLKRLTLSFNKINDAQVLNLPNLEYLNVANNALTSLQSFTKLIKLSVLNIAFNPIDDQGYTISAIFSNLRAIIATGTRIVHPNLIIRFAPNIEHIDIANTRVSQMQDVQALVRKAIRLQQLDLRGSPLNQDYYPDIKGQTIDSREEYACLEDYDRHNPSNNVQRDQYRKLILGAASSPDIKQLDGIHIENDEARFLKAAVEQKKNDESDESEPENETDNLVNNLQQQNAELRTEKMQLQQQELIDKIMKLIRKRDSLRRQMNLPINDDVNEDEFQQYTLNQLADYKDELKQIIRSLSKDMKKSTHSQDNHDNSKELNKERRRNKGLKNELKQAKGSSKKKNDDDFSEAIDELQQENQRLSQEMQKARNRHEHKSHTQTPDNRSNKIDRKAPRSENNGNKYRKQADPDKIHLASQLMAENSLLRNTLGLDPLDYHPAETFDSAEIDEIISQLMRHNKKMRDQVAQQSKNGKGGKTAQPTKQLPKYNQYDDLQGSREGCTFWVPLDAKTQKEEEEYYRKDMQMRLPVLVEPSIKKVKSGKGCSKCENAILMMSRVPLYPPDSSRIMDGCDEFQLVESWIVTSMNKRVKLSNLTKSSFFYRIIENERTMPNIRLVVILTNEAQHYLTEGIDKSIMVADHFTFIAQELKKNGSAQVLICAFDDGNQATNFCEHPTIPNVQQLKSMNQSFDSLRFLYQNEEAIMALNTSRLVPLYAVQVDEMQ